MNSQFSQWLILEDEVKSAIRSSVPVVALESTLITHGLPYPENTKIALEMETEVRKVGAVPATIAILDGVIQVGLGREKLEQLGKLSNIRKVSTRDIALAVALGSNGGTTVAATAFIANHVGIKIFATGGIGGVHRPSGKGKVSYDVSTDLIELSRTPIIVICAGAKAILDISATLEHLETLAVPVIGFRTNDFPAFYSRSSGYPVNVRVDTPDEISQIAKRHWAIGLSSALMVANPLPEEASVPREYIEKIIGLALEEADRSGISGQEVTPFLLHKVSELTAGSSMDANRKLLLNNARLAAQIAVSYWEI